MTYWRKSRLRMIEGGRARHVSPPDIGQHHAWNLWPIMMVQLCALIWAGICWLFGAFS